MRDASADRFSSEVNGFLELIERRHHDTFIFSTVEVNRSVVKGSDITGAPGQPIDTGNLVTSWISEYTDQWSWELMTNVEYAPYVEENVRGITFHNHGPHSVALTIAGWTRIVEYAVAEAKKAA